MRTTEYKIIFNLFLVLLFATAVVAQDFTFRLRGTQPFGPAIIGNYGILDVAFYASIFLIIYSATFTGLKRTSAFAKEQNAAKIIALGVSIATLTFILSTEYAFGATIQQTIGRGVPTWITTPAILLIGLFIGYKLYKWINS